MSFSPKAWKNQSESKTTPLSAAALIDMEKRLSAYTDTVGFGAQAASSGALPAPLVASIGSAPVGGFTNSKAEGRTCRGTFLAPGACTDIQLVWANWKAKSGVEEAGASNVTYKASIEYEGTVYPVTIRGVRSFTLEPWGVVATDPIGLELPEGAVFSVRVFVNTPATGTAISCGVSGKAGPGYEQAGDGYANGDLTESGAMTTGLGEDYVLPLPHAICGRPIGTRKPQVALLGDSITRGNGDHGNSCWALRALAGEYPAMNLGVFGEKVGNVVKTGIFLRRATLLATCTSALVLFGTNDLPTRTAAEVKSDLVTFWRRMSNRGMKVFAATLPPRSTSTDSFATVEKQTPHEDNAQRILLNNWIRAGAPIDSSDEPVEDGTPGALVAGDAGHPLATYFETADKVESARDSGKWKATGSPEGWTADGTHPSETGHAAMAEAVDTSLLV